VKERERLRERENRQSEREKTNRHIEGEKKPDTERESDRQTYLEIEMVRKTEIVRQTGR
jgi:hypothetical protein